MPRSSIRRIVAGTAHLTGLTAMAIRWGDQWALPQPGLPRRRSEGVFLVLVYHRVNDLGLPMTIETLDSETFRRQVRYVARQFTVTPLGEVLTRIETGRELPSRCACITFDDGYRDNYEVALPILREEGLPATVFLTAGCIERREALWFDRVLTAFRESRVPVLALPEREPLSLRTATQRWTAALRTLMEFKNCEADARAQSMTELLRALDVEEDGTEHELLLTWDQVAAMAREGIEFGSHTMTHRVLSTCPVDQARRELEDSKRLIEERVGRPVRLFAYPHGKPEDVGPAAERAVRDAGYGLAFTTIYGANTSGSDRYRLRRVPPWPADIPSFAMNLATAVCTAGAERTGNGGSEAGTVVYGEGIGS